MYERTENEFIKIDHKKHKIWATLLSNQYWHWPAIISDNTARCIIEIEFKKMKFNYEQPIDIVAGDHEIKFLQYLSKNKWHGTHGIYFRTVRHELVKIK